MRVYEDLKYKKHYIGDNRLSQIFQLGLFVDNGELDKELHEQTYLFRENLKIRPSGAALSSTDQLHFVSNQMSLNVFIDDVKCEIQNVIITCNGIQVSFLSEHDEANQNLEIEMMFNMPQLKGYSEFLVSISEPTYSPMISFPIRKAR